MNPELDVRVGTAADSRARSELLAGLFLSDFDQAISDRRQMVNEPERSLVATDGEQLVGTAAILSREMSVPGASLPAAHVTAVGVAPTHRRRGLLRRLMETQLGQIRDRGVEPIAALWASESGIYGRYGYGLASSHVSYSIATAETSVPGQTPAGRLRMVPIEDVRDQLADLFERVRLDRPGMSNRPGRWWEYLVLDPESRRDGMSARRCVVYEDDGHLQGYALWRVKSERNATGPAGRVHVSEFIAGTSQAYAALWRFLLEIDLTRTVTYHFAAVDEPLPHLVTNAEAVGVETSTALWVRVVDVPTALAARCYAAPVDVVLEIGDPLLSGNSGRWHLVGDATSATCKPTDAEPALSLDVATLGAAYLGGTSLTSLADAGRVDQHQPGVLASTSVAFGWHCAPTAVEIF
ncbi:GNAT family N-acetyltransferase [Phytoactinopolyspora limicola]|uniref:GNAT family N-acetyltransferase n=1 Tax=Phytoactinopolyspora limicola TaxID=2715536 RepID=UPI00140E57C9|nr:GNAT family N-acetyltransferase [Phytoactinopolyspora limicola]